MSFGTTAQKQQLAAAATATPTTSSPLNSSSNLTNSSLSFPKAFTATQNCLRPLQPHQQHQKRPLPSASNPTPMIKNNENSSNVMEWNESEEKDKENIIMLQRRESIPDDAGGTTRLNTIQESKECNISCPQPLLTSLNLKTQRHDSLSNQSTTAPSVTITSGSAANSPSDEIAINQINNSSTIDITSTSAVSSNSASDNASSPSGASGSANKETDISLTSAASKSNNNTPSPSGSPSSRLLSAGKQTSKASVGLTSTVGNSNQRIDEDTISKSSDTSGELVRGVTSPELGAGVEKSKSGTRLSERAKKKSWYNVLYPNYKSRSQDFKKLFKDVPNDERLIVDYSCALQRDILVQGRLYVSQNYVCFHANIFRWETYLTIKWKDVTSITKEKTALVIPNAISICTTKEKYFFATFTSRDKAFLMLFRVWQNTLMNKPMLPQETWKWVHNCYGEELGLTTDDEDYIDPTSVPDETEVDTDFFTAIEDVNSPNSSSVGITELSTTSSSNKSQSTATSASNQNLNQNLSPNPNPNSGNSSTSSGGGSSGVTKSRSRSFFRSNKSNLNTSTNASASGSDNKGSDNNSSTVRNSKNQMIPNTKELTLTSVSPDEEDAVAINPISEARENKRKVSKNSRQRDESLNKNVESLPTDASGSSDSDENKIPFVQTAECTSAHEGRQLMHTILPINIDTLFNLLYSKSKFLNEFHTMRKSTDRQFGEWITNADGQKTRTVTVTVQLGASVGPKTSKVTEEQMLRDCSKPGELYSIDINSVNAGIPYADSFCVFMHHCLVRTVDDHTMLSVHAQIKYKKSVWGVVKGFIEKNAWAGLEDFYTSLLRSLQSEICIPPAKGKGRRPRRGTAGQVRSLEEIPLAQAKFEPVEAIQAVHTTATYAPTAGQAKAGGSKQKNMWLSICVIILISFLIVLNVILLFKLRKLEERIDEDIRYRERMPNLTNLEKLPTTPEDWIQLLREQEILHETELKKWHVVLQTAIDLLKKTEKTLAELMFR